MVPGPMWDLYLDPLQVLDPMPKDADCYIRQGDGGTKTARFG